MVERRIVEHDRVQLVARGERADLAEKFAAAHRRDVKRLIERQRRDVLIAEPPAELRGLNGMCHRAEQVFMAASGNICGKTYVQPVLQIAADGRDAGGEVHVRFRRVRHKDAVLQHPLLLGLAGVDAVRHDTGIAAAEQAKLVIGVAVELALGAKLADPVDLAVVFGQMALHRQIVLFAQARKAEHQIVRAGGDEARREDGLRALEGVFGIENPAFSVAQGMVR